MPFVAVFTDKGKMVAFSGDRNLVAFVSARLGDVLPPAGDPDEEDLRAARQKVLRRLADDGEGAGEKRG